MFIPLNKVINRKVEALLGSTGENRFRDTIPVAEALISLTGYCRILRTAVHRKQKNMKKSIYIVTMFALFSMAVMPVLADTVLTTQLERDSSGGLNPIIKAKWEMNVAKDQNGKYLGTDDATTTGAQLMPSGVFQNNKHFAICGIATDPNGVADINEVYADVFYPKDIYLGPNHEAHRQGCGALIREISLTKLSKMDGINLVCDKIRTNNTNLPVWNESGLYNYDEVCKMDGELWKETAYVYCGEMEISYEDPSGEYRTIVMAQDKAGLDGTLQNYFEYLPLTAFETDFTNVSYGAVRLNTPKIINGDLTWGGPLASVRNVGNTRLDMFVNQDDMDLGQTNNLWNVEYKARVGSDADWATYLPEATQRLQMSLNLSELDEMDFSILIKKFPPESGPYTGTMCLSAEPVKHLECVTGS